MEDHKDPIVVEKTPVVETGLDLELEVKEIKAQNEYLLEVIKKMAKHMNCEGIL